MTIGTSIWVSRVAAGVVSSADVGGYATARSAGGRRLVADWLAAHPEHPPIPHVEDGPADAMDDDQARSLAAIDATDPGSILEPDHGGSHSDSHAEERTDAPAAAG